MPGEPSTGSHRGDDPRPRLGVPGGWDEEETEACVDEVNDR